MEIVMQLEGKWRGIRKIEKKKKEKNWYYFNFSSSIFWTKLRERD